MNFVAHLVVADALAGPGGAYGGPDPSRSLGAALPDLVPMAGLRFDRARLTSGLSEGVDCHYRTDRAFHALDVFVTGAARLRADLEAQGLPAGASRAIGHAGWELLLDGALARRPGVRASFVTALGCQDQVRPAFPEAGRDRWTGLAERLAAEGWWERSDDPLAIAERLHRVLGRRPRLAFEAGDLGRVAAILDVAQPAVERSAGSVVGAVVHAVVGAMGAPDR